MACSRAGESLLWFARSTNVKTGDVPGCVVGRTRAQTWRSCEGCARREGGCYAWETTTGSLLLHKVLAGYERHPEHYTLDSALKRRAKSARMVRIGVIGDPARARRAELLRAVRETRACGLSVVGYTHFWREAASQELRDLLMASCDSLPEADLALRMGWRPSVVMPWDHARNHGPVFTTPQGAKGVICPAQTKSAVTCNTCRLCDPQHPAWKKGKLLAIGFLDHSREARKIARRALPLLPDVQAPPSAA